MTVSMTGGELLVQCISNPLVFLHTFPFELQVGVLHTLLRIFGRDIYCVARFRGGGLLGSSNCDTHGFVHRLLTLIIHAASMEHQQPSDDILSTLEQQRTQTAPLDSQSSLYSKLVVCGAYRDRLMDRNPVFCHVVELLVRLVGAVGMAGLSLIHI